MLSQTKSKIEGTFFLYVSSNLSKDTDHMHLQQQFIKHAKKLWLVHPKTLSKGETQAIANGC